MDLIIYILIIFIICIIFIVCFEVFDDINNEIKWPFKHIYDENGNKLNILALSAPLRTIEDENNYIKYKNIGYYFCGISSYLNFPDKITNPFEDRFHEERKHDYLKMVDTWIHCFKKPSQQLINSNLPLLLLTEADLKNPDHYTSNENIDKEYDFIYINLNDNDKCEPGWNWHNRNWDLAKKCLEIMCSKYKLKGLIVGRENCEFTEKCNKYITVVPFLPFHEFIKTMQKCKFIFVPNISDASPRVITDALCLNIPALVNYNIIGGWHNVVTGITGEFFTDETNISYAIEKLIFQNSYSPRKWYLENRGIHNSGVILSKFLIKHYPNINNKSMKYAYI
jgi:hypothetical protein